MSGTPWLLILTICHIIVSSFSLKQWVSIGHLYWRCSLPAIRMRSWLPITSWITCMNLTNDTIRDMGFYGFLPPVLLSLSSPTFLTWYYFCFIVFFSSPTLALEFSMLVLERGFECPVQLLPCFHSSLISVIFLVRMYKSLHRRPVFLAGGINICCEIFCISSFKFKIV